MLKFFNQSECLKIPQRKIYAKKSLWDRAPVGVSDKNQKERRGFQFQTMSPNSLALSVSVVVTKF